MIGGLVQQATSAKTAKVTNYNETAVIIAEKCQDMEGWVGLGDWLHIEINVRHRELNLDTVTHLSTNRDQRRLTLLIKTNMLPLCHTATESEMTWVYSTCYRCAGHNESRRAASVHDLSQLSPQTPAHTQYNTTIGQQHS